MVTKLQTMQEATGGSVCVFVCVCVCVWVWVGVSARLFCHFSTHTVVYCQVRLNFK